jgi:tRNA nucleotidyltransferase/poly(A) polymerase
LESVSPERIRDELFRILEGQNPAGCIRALDLLGALEVILPELSVMKGVSQPAPHQQDVWGHVMTILGTLESVLAILDNGSHMEAGENLLNGLLSMRIGRYRNEISAQLCSHLAGQRTLRGLLFLAALYHNVAKPHTQNIDEEGQLRFWDHDQQGAEIAGERARHLALSNEEITRLETIIRNHMRILFHINRLEKDGKLPSRRAIYRFFHDAGQAGVDLCLLALADIRATYQLTLSKETWEVALEVVRLLLDNWYEKPFESVAPPPLLDGDDLMKECQLVQGPKIGELLEAIREAQAMGEVSTREQALALARSKLG